MLSACRRLFRRHPLLANTAIYGSLFAGAELSQQLIIRQLQVKRGEPAEPLDRESIGRYCIFGYVVLPPILHAWYKWLDWKYVGVAPRIIAKKVFLDVAVLGPVDVFIFFYSMAWMEGKEDKMEELRAKYVDTVFKEIYFWVPAQVINFVFVPPAFRVIFVGACAFAWNNILCWVKRSDFKVADAEAESASATGLVKDSEEETVKPWNTAVSVGDDDTGVILSAWNKAMLADKAEKSDTGVILKAWNQAMTGSATEKTVLLNNRNSVSETRTEVVPEPPKLRSRPEIQEMTLLPLSVAAAEGAADDAC